MWLRIVVGLLAFANIGFGISGYLDISVLFHDGNGLDLSNTLIKTVSNEFAARNLGIGIGMLIVSAKGVPESIAIMTIVRALIEIQTIIMNLFSTNIKGVFMASPFLVLELFVIVCIIQIIKKRDFALT